MSGSEKPVKGQTYLCKLAHFHGKLKDEVLLVFVGEDDCDWKTADDMSELNFDWHVVSWKKIGVDKNESRQSKL